VSALDKAFDISLKRFNLQLKQSLDQIGVAAQSWGGDDLVSAINNTADILRVMANNGTPLQ
jgi:hypothetical protein